MRDAAPHGIDLVLLEDRGVSLALAVDLDVEDRVEAGGAGERAAQLALGDADRDRLAAAVEDARHEPSLRRRRVSAEPSLSRCGDEEFCAFSGHTGGGV